MPTVSIAGGQGFYGDTPAAVDALLAEGIEYLCLEALAELTLGGDGWLDCSSDARAPFLSA